MRAWIGVAVLEGAAFLDHRPAIAAADEDTAAFTVVVGSRTDDLAFATQVDHAALGSSLNGLVFGTREDGGGSAHHDADKDEREDGEVHVVV